MLLLFLFSGGLQKSTYAFSVYWLADTSLISGNVVIFTRKPLDEGALYDTNTGKYNVPVSGLYFFTSGLCVNKGDYGAINIVADGTRIGAFDAVDYDLHTCSTGSALAKLEKNTKVWLVVTADTSARNTDTYGGFNYFSGYLISEQH